jgi:hypothetical protein
MGSRIHPSPHASRGNVGWCRIATRRRDGKASVARSFRLVTRDGVARTTSRTSSSSPPASPIPAPFIQARSASKGNSDGGPVHPFGAAHAPRAGVADQRRQDAEAQSASSERRPWMAVANVRRRGLGSPEPSHHLRSRLRRRSELAITDSEERLIAPAASIGLVTCPSRG